MMCLRNEPTIKTRVLPCFPVKINHCAFYFWSRHGSDTRLPSTSTWKSLGPTTVLWWLERPAVPVLCSFPPKRKCLESAWSSPHGIDWNFIPQCDVHCLSTSLYNKWVFFSGFDTPTMHGLITSVTPGRCRSAASLQQTSVELQQFQLDPTALSWQCLSMLGSSRLGCRVIEIVGLELKAWRCLKAVVEDDYGM